MSNNEHSNQRTTASAGARKILISKKVMIHFSDSDPQGIAYFNSVLQMAHESLEEYWASQTAGWAYWFHNPDFAVPIRHCSCDFYKPLLVGKNYQSDLAVTEISETAITFSFRIVESDDLYAEATTTHVFVDKKNFKKRSVPAEVHSLLS